MKKVYIFKTEKVEQFFSSRLFGRAFSSEWLTIEPSGRITIKEGYAWDGCTPKTIVKDLVIGTPDGAPLENHRPKTYFASMVHDALYQFKQEVPVTRKEADLIFLDMLLGAEFYWAKVYFIAVRMFGGLMGKWEAQHEES